MNFTIEERDKINDIYARKCENLTADEVRLLVAWESDMAAQHAIVSEQMNMLKNETDARIEQARKEADNAMAALNELANAAIARLERIDEQTKQN